MSILGVARHQDTGRYCVAEAHPQTGKLVQVVSPYFDSMTEASQWRDAHCPAWLNPHPYQDVPNDVMAQRALDYDREERRRES
jgi:hypothetical protein